jgi:hypothetical protein
MNFIDIMKIKASDSLFIHSNTLNLVDPWVIPCK